MCAHKIHQIFITQTYVEVWGFGLCHDSEKVMTWTIFGVIHLDLVVRVTACQCYRLEKDLFILCFQRLLADPRPKREGQRGETPLTAGLCINSFAVASRRSHCIYLSLLSLLCVFFSRGLLLSVILCNP